MPAQLKVSVAKIKDIPYGELGRVAQDVSKSIYDLNVGTFKGIKPVTQLLFDAATASYISERTTYKLGGLMNKKNFEDAYDLLIGMMIQLAPYVNGIANGDEDILKLSMLPYTTGANETGLIIHSGVLPWGLEYKVGTTGKAHVTCAYYGPATKYICIVSEGKPMPLGTKMLENGQISFPGGVEAPPFIMNIDGARDKIITGMKPKVDYYLTYIVMCGGFVSDLSEAVIIVCGN